MWPFTNRTPSGKNCKHTSKLICYMEYSYFLNRIYAIRTKYNTINKIWQLISIN